MTWKTAIPGRGHSSPIVWRDRIFLTTAVEGPSIPGARAVTHYRKGEVYRHPQSEGGDRLHDFKVLCLDRATGRILWERTAYQGTPHDDRHRRNAYASGTPVTDGQFVWAFFDSEGLFCYDFEGRLIWKKSLGPIAKGGMGHGMSPVLFDNLIILQVDKEGMGLTTTPQPPSEDQFGEESFITALDRATGRTVWSTPRNHRRSWATPLLLDTSRGPQLISSGAESVIVYDPATGRELWTSAGVVSHPIPSPVAGDGLVFVSAGSRTKRLDALQISPPPAPGQEAKVAWSYDKGTAYVPSPIYYRGHLYLLTDKGMVTCLQGQDGQVVYTERLPLGSGYRASPVAFDGKILFSGEDGDVTLISAGPEFKMLSQNSLGEAIWASPALSRGQIFIRGERHIFAIGGASEDAETGGRR